MQLTSRHFLLSLKAAAALSSFLHFGPSLLSPVYTVCDWLTETLVLLHSSFRKPHHLRNGAADRFRVWRLGSVCSALPRIYSIAYSRFIQFTSPPSSSFFGPSRREVANTGRSWRGFLLASSLLHWLVRHTVLARASMLMSVCAANYR